MSYFYPGQQGNTNANNLQQQQSASSYFYPGGNNMPLQQQQSSHFYPPPQQQQQQQQLSVGSPPSLMQQQSSGSFFYPGAFPNNNNNNNNGLFAREDSDSLENGGMMQKSTSGSYFYNDAQLAQQGRQNSNNNNDNTNTAATSQITTNYIFGQQQSQQQPPLQQQYSSAAMSNYANTTTVHPYQQQQQQLQLQQLQQQNNRMVMQMIPGQLFGPPGDGDIIEIAPSYDSSKRVQAVAGIGSGGTTASINVSNALSPSSSSSSSSSFVDATRPVYLSVGARTSDFTQRFRVHYSIDGFVGSCTLEPLTAPTRAIAVAQTTHLILADKNDKTGTVSFWVKQAGGAAPGTFVIQSAAVDGQNISVTSSIDGTLQLSLAPAAGPSGTNSNFQHFKFIKSDATITSSSDFQNMSAHVHHQTASATSVFTATAIHTPPTNFANPAGGVNSVANSGVANGYSNMTSSIPVPSHLTDEATGARGPRDGPSNNNNAAYTGPSPTQLGFARPPGQLSFGTGGDGISSNVVPPPGPSQLQGKIYQGSTVVGSNYNSTNVASPPSLPPSTTTANALSDEGNECVVCLTARKTHLFAPCGHLAICGECAKQFQKGGKCPVCRMKYDNVIKVYQ